MTITPPSRWHAAAADAAGGAQRLVLVRPWPEEGGRSRPLCLALPLLMACPVPPGVECAELAAESNLRVSILSRGVGGQAVFSCPAGFALLGPTHTVCQASGDWAGPFPTCKGANLARTTRTPSGSARGASARHPTHVAQRGAMAERPQTGG